MRHATFGGCLQPILIQIATRKIIESDAEREQETYDCWPYGKSQCYICSQFENVIQAENWITQRSCAMCHAQLDFKRDCIREQKGMCSKAELLFVIWKRPVVQSMPISNLLPQLKHVPLIVAITYSIKVKHTVVRKDVLVFFIDGW